VKAGAGTLTAESLRGQWKRAGYRFACPESRDPVDIEHLVAQSAEVGRDYPELFWSAATWLTEFGDLVSIHRFSRMALQGQGHVVGALMELAVEQGGDSRLLKVARRCRPAALPEPLFSIMGGAKATRDYESENNLPLFARWGLLCSSVSLKTDALEQRSAVLRNNRTLALRALFGAGVRADILAALSDGAAAYIRQVATATGYSYQPVHAEIQHLIRNGIVSCERLGTASLVRLSPQALQMTRGAFA
jgi:hypothetical protein